jgi:hypothetical protein
MTDDETPNGDLRDGEARPTGEDGDVEGHEAAPGDEPPWGEPETGTAEPEAVAAEPESVMLGTTPPPDADAPTWAGADEHPHDDRFRDDGSAAASGARIEIHQGGSERIDAREVSVFQGGAGTIRGDQVRVEQGGAFAIIGRRIEMREAGAFILIAKRATGDVRVALDWRGIAALFVGLALLLVVRGRR